MLALRRCGSDGPGRIEADSGVRAGRILPGAAVQIDSVDEVASRGEAGDGSQRSGWRSRRSSTTRGRSAGDDRRECRGEGEEIDGKAMLVIHRYVAEGRHGLLASIGDPGRRESNARGW